MPASSAASSAVVISTRLAVASGRRIGPAFEPLGPNRQPVTIPVQDLEAIPALVDEDEEVTGEGIERQGTGDQGREAVEAFPHVGRFFGEVDTYGGAQPEHGDSSTRAMSWRRVWGSKPGATAIRRPLLRHSSRGCRTAAVGRDGIGKDGDGKEAGRGAVGGGMVRRGRLRGGYAVEAFSEGMDGDAASLAEFGLSQAAAAEIVEEGVPAEVEDAAPRHGVISQTGLRAPAGRMIAGGHAAIQMHFTGRTRYTSYSSSSSPIQGQRLGSVRGSGTLYTVAPFSSVTRTAMAVPSGASSQIGFSSA